jgi:hypothetical protein
MPGERRRIGVDPDFFAHLDAQLPPERTEALPSVGDFQAYELPDILRRFETGWAELPPWPGLEGARVLIATGQS